MSMVEEFDNIPNGIPGDEEFDNILNIFDFPMESLEDDGFVSDWDITKSHCLGPIPPNVLMGSPMIPDVKVDTRLVVPIDGSQEQKQPFNHVKASGPHIAEAQESSVFQTQSPISVLESSGSCSGGKSLPINSPIAIPVRARSKRPKRPGSNPWASVSTYFAATASASKRTSAPRKDDKDKEKKLPDSWENSLRGVPSCPVVSKKCTHCEVTKTPQWREGPLGPKTLCNACGVRYRSGRLFPEYRPLASPTFVPSMHSNSHKKVVEMRNKGKQPVTKIKEEPPVSSPQPEFVPMSSYLFDYIY